MNNAAVLARLPGRISRGGQISIPAPIRHRWATDRVLLEDRGDAILVRPVPADPIAAARGMFRGLGPSSDEMKELERQEDERIEAEKERRR